MVVPDLGLICEIMLVAEGFLEARMLSRKFITLYTLCKELLSKQDHYDWGLRAIKSVLVVAGALKRGDPERPEDQVNRSITRRGLDHCCTLGPRFCCFDFGSSLAAAGHCPDRIPTCSQPSQPK